MSARHITLAEWLEQQRARDPAFDRKTAESLQGRGSKRKVPLLLDENLELDFIAELRAVDYLKITVARSGASDKTIWAEARRTGQIIVTADEDFWDDRNFPLARSPGVIVLAGRTAEDKITSLATAFGILDIKNNWRKVPNFLDSSKLKASANGVASKFLHDGQIVVGDAPA